MHNKKALVQYELKLSVAISMNATEPSQPHFEPS
jgi:hypothetical protein